MEAPKLRYQPWTSRVLVDLPEGFVSVADPFKPQPTLWVPPGGKGELHDHHPEAAAKRELWQETGLLAKSLTLIHEETRENHSDPNKPYTLYLFKAELDRKGLSRLKPYGDEKEYVRVIPRDELRTMTNYHPLYKRMLTELGYWPT